jgi:hypothetical protein
MFLPCVPHAFGAGADEENFKKSMEYTQRVIDKQHLISLVDIDLNFEKKTSKEEKRSYRYDHYPEVERIQMKKDGAAYAREKGKKWLKSDDWGKTGQKVPAEKVEALDAMVTFAMVPFSTPVSRDNSQGGNVIELVDRETHDGYDLVFYEMRRERPTGFAYPKFVFLKYPKDSEDRLLLKGFAGTVRSGEDRVWVNINYEYMFMVNIVEEKPKTEKQALPAPEDDKIYNFTELDEKKFELKGKVVRVQITSWGMKGEEVGNGLSSYMVKDTAQPKAFYGKVDFPTEGAQKLGFGEKAAKGKGKGKDKNGDAGKSTIYVLVTPRTKEVVAQFTALGTKFKKSDDGKASYSW